MNDESYFSIEPSLDDSAKLDVKGIVKKATELNDFGHLLEHVPYAKFIGMAV
ncbi:PaaI family thioesterase, partial [Shewanella sp. 0m-11]